MNGTDKRYVKGPFEAYYNEFTEKYHLVRHTGPLACGKAHGCKLYGKYDSMDKAKDIMLTQIMEVLDELG